MFKVIIKIVFLIILSIYASANEKGTTPSTVNLNETYTVYFNVNESPFFSQYSSTYLNSDGSLKSQYRMSISTRLGDKNLDTTNSKYWNLNLKAYKTGTIYHTFYVRKNTGAYYSLGRVSVTVSTLPSAPNLIQNSNGIQISWNSVNGTTKYRLLKSTNSNGGYEQIYCGSNKSYSDVNVIDNYTYYYKIQAGVSATSCYDPEGWSNPSAYKAIKISTVNTNHNVNIFDGAGSLVSPNEDCYGCDKDIAVMHPHSGYNSTVVFQWLYNSDTCKQVNISAEENIETIIKAKAWDEQLTKKSFKVKLGANPITLKRPSGSNWITFAISSIKPINSSIQITAECQGYNSPYYSGGAVSSNKDLVEMKDNYIWTGTGSIITQAKDRNFDDYGIGQDIAVLFKNKNSITSFQWLASSKCSKLNVSDYKHQNININELKIKGWAEGTWSSNKCNSLPCILNAPNGIDKYYIIKVKTGSNTIMEALKATCIE